MRIKPFLFGVRALFVASALAAVALAKPEVRVEAAPMLGAASPVGPGWVTIQVRLENPGAAPVSAPWSCAHGPGGRASNERRRDPSPVRARAARSSSASSCRPTASPGALLSSAFGFTTREPREIANAGIGEFRQVDPLLFDLSTPSRIAATVRGQGVGSSCGARAVPTAAPSSAISSPMVDPATGEPLLPRWAAGYSNATLVVAPGRRLSTLPARPRRP